MLDALLYSVRDGLRGAGFGYDYKTCEIMDDGRPPPRAGKFFASVHDGAMTSETDNQLFELYNFSVTLTMRVVVPLDRVGDQQIARNAPRLDPLSNIPLAEKNGFNAKVHQLAKFLHMNWRVVVLVGKNPADLLPLSANDYLSLWATGTVYGFVEPMRFLNAEKPSLAGGEWFAAEPDAKDFGIKSTLSFGRCKRFQPITTSNGPFA